MKQKWNEKPVTWGGLTALYAVCYIIAIVGCACYYIAWFQPTWVIRLKEAIMRCFGKTTHKEGTQRRRSL